MYLINQQDEKKQKPPEKTYPAVFAALPVRTHGVLRQGASGGVAARVHALLQTHTRRRGGGELFTTCGPDQHTGVHLSAGSTQIKTFRSRGVHFLSGGSFLLDFTATFETRWRCVHRVSRVLDLESDSLEGKKYKSGRFGKIYIFKKTLRLWGGSGLKSSSLI